MVQNNEGAFVKLLQTVHSDRRVLLEQFPALKEHFVGDRFLYEDIEAVLVGGATGEETAKILSVVCLLCKSKHCEELLARMMFSAMNNDELINFVLFALTLTPIYPKIVTLSVRHLLMNIEKFTQELQHFGARYTKSYFTPETRFIRNLLTLILWQRHANAESNMKCLGLHLTDLKGDLQEKLMKWGLIYIEKVERHDDQSLETIHCLLDLLRAISPTAKLLLRNACNIFVLFTGLVTSLLRLVDHEKFGTDLDGIDVLYSCYGLAGVFFEAQTAFTNEFLIEALLDEVFENSSKLFGTKKNLSCIRGEIDYEQYPASLLNPSKESTEESLIKQVRALSFRSKTAHSMAHTGVFEKRRLRIEDVGLHESESLRSFLLIYMIEIVCVAPDNKSFDELRCKWLGIKLIERFCKDGLTSGIGWDDWKLELKLIGRYNETAKLMEEMSFVKEFIMMLAGAGAMGLRYAMPLIRAQFVSILSQLEQTIRGDAQVSQQHLCRIARIFSFFMTAEFITDTLNITFDVLCKATNHEASSILSCLWRVVQHNYPAGISYENRVDALIDDDMLLRQVEGAKFVSMVVAVAQRYISKVDLSLARLIGRSMSSWKREDDWS